MKPKIVNSGVTRHVILIHKYAIKIPRLNYGWGMFLKGLLGNMQETLHSRLNDSRICPVIFSIWGGWLIIMPRCEMISMDDFCKLDIEYYWGDEKIFHRGEWEYLNEGKVPVEHKIDSFGWYNDKIVAIDYGS